jgi:pyruvate formate lyase activating enzyme
MSVDPIEKKPLAHFQPGTTTMSIASASCNLACPWCQNHTLSDVLREAPDGASGAGEPDDAEIPGDFVTPQEVVDAALRHGCASVSYTYSEPTIHYEHNREVGLLARGRGLRNVFVTNGLLSVDAARDAATSFLDAANVDLKAMRESTYRQHCQGPLGAVLDCIRTLHELGVWLEVTTLVIGGLNDDETELRDAARFLAGIDVDIPWHLSRYHPAHRFRRAPSTPVGILRRAREIGLEEGLRYVYTGNVWGDDGEHTRCPGCGVVVVHRRGFASDPVALRNGHCTHCGTRIAGVDLP